MGAEGAKMLVKHPYLSGQWTEQIKEIAKAIGPAD